jgi:hypothetical protein
MPRRKQDFCPHCGVELDDPTAPRSDKQWGGFHHMVGLALKNWPEAHPTFKPQGATKTDRREHLRAWLLVQAGYKMTIGEPLNKQQAMDWEIVKRVVAVAMQPDLEYPYRFPDERDGALVVDVPKSMKHITHGEFQPVFDEVLFLIERETGIKVEFIKRELRIYERHTRDNHARARRPKPAGAEVPDR